MMKYKDTVILLYAKAPLPGKVNTRLIPSTGIQVATRLQYNLLHQRLSSLTTLPICNVVLMCAPDCHHPCFCHCGDVYQLPLITQSGADLGQRMANGILQALATKSYVVVIGTDAPSLTRAAIEHSIQQLHQPSTDVVINPAEDGGYVLIGLTQNTQAVLPTIFTGIDWGSGKVLQQTCKKIKLAGLHYKQMPTYWDIDSYADYQRYLKNPDVGQDGDSVFHQSI